MRRATNRSDGLVATIPRTITVTKGHQCLSLRRWVYTVSTILILVTLNALRTSLQYPLKLDHPVDSRNRKRRFDFGEAESSGVSLFYNLYVPLHPEGVANALTVLTEQIEQLGQSYLVKQPSGDKSVLLYYNLIGNRDGITDDTVGSLCEKAGFACRFMHHFAAGAYEEVTLELLHQYCLQHETHRVLYFHSKGSFHDTPKNSVWRRNMLEAVTSPDCLNPPDSTCNLCGLLFFPVWQMMMPGNFFVTSCSYVKELRSPLDYKERLTAIVHDRRNLGYSSRIYNPACYNLGIGRFASELWIGSHPDMVPCDLAGVADIDYWKTVPWETSSLNTTFGLAPRFPITDTWQNLKHDRLNRIQEKPNSLLREYYLLAGVLYRYAEIYQQLPGKSSWIWEWFPDGELWKEILPESTLDATATIHRVLRETPKDLYWWLFQGDRGSRCKKHE